VNAAIKRRIYKRIPFDSVPRLPGPRPHKIALQLMLAVPESGSRATQLSWEGPQLSLVSPFVNIEWA
jgi:hypothetical protein